MFVEILIGSTIVLGTTLFLKNETEKLEITKHEVENNKIPKEFDGFKIIQISDLHNKSFGKNNEKLLKKVEYEKPDIVVITGDLVEGDNNKYHVALNLVEELTKNMRFII